jgi:uncharacterized protein (DUF433 family)
LSSSSSFIRHHLLCGKQYVAHSVWRTAAIVKGETRESEKVALLAWYDAADYCAHVQMVVAVCKIVRISMADLLDRITMDPAINHGKPVIRGLRYPVETLLELLSSGMTIDEILADYEDLEREDVLAALAFAARLSQVIRMELIDQ